MQVLANIQPGQSIHIFIIYSLCAALPIAAWLKYFFLVRYKKIKSRELKIRELMTLFGMICLSYLTVHLIFYSYETFSAMPQKVFLLSVFLALIPAIIWIYIVYTKRINGIRSKKKKKYELILVIAIFFLGILTVPLLNLYNNYVVDTPKLDYYVMLEEAIVKPEYDLISALSPNDPGFQAQLSSYQKAKNIYDTITIVIDAWLEEIIKLSLLLFFIHAVKPVKTIGDAITFSILAGLGFAFIENIYYFVRVYLDNGGDKQVFFSVVVFRAIVLSIGHMTFSGIFGYFYGLSRFGLPLYEERRWEGNKFPLVRLFSKIFRLPMAHAYAALLFTEGMLLAMLTHATFNSFLGFGARDYAVYLVILSGIYVYYLTQRKAGHLVLATFGRKKLSLMAPKDEDVVLELAGMWIKEEKYKEVEEMCQRLEQKDPDNAVVKLLYAKAHDKRRVKRAKLAMASLFFQEDIFEEDVSIFQKWKQIRAEREATAKGVNMDIAEDLTPTKTFEKKLSNTKSPTPKKKKI